MNKAIIAVSFGTTYVQSRKETIENIEKKIRQNFPDYDFYRAFTSNIVRKRVLEKEGLKVFSIQEALNHLKENGYKEVIIVSLHMIKGHEYRKITDAIEKYKTDFEKIQLTTPVLEDEDSIRNFAKKVGSMFKNLKSSDTLIFMGHGSNHKNDINYEKLNTSLEQIYGKGRYFVGTVEGKIQLEDVIKYLKENGKDKVYMTPLMIVCGDHAHNDMAGEDEESWVAKLNLENIDVQPIMKGLGQYDEFCDIFIEKIKTL